MKGKKYAWNSTETHIVAVTRPVPTQTHQSHMAEAVFHPTVQALVHVFYELHLGQRCCPPCQGPPLIHTGVWSSNRWWTLTRCSWFFFQFWPFNKSYYRNDLTKTLFPVLALLVMPNIVVWFWTESRQTPQHDSWPRRHWLSRQFGRSRHVFRYQKWVTPCWLAWP
jgi:hypothetical protein